MSKTYAIYQQSERGMFRVGTFTYRGKGTSVRILSDAFHARHPHAHEGGKLFIASRRKLFGQWRDGELLPMEEPK